MSSMSPSIYERMSQSTSVFFGSVSASPITWRRGPFEVIEANGIKGFAFTDAEAETGNQESLWMSADDLPTEFFNHQLMEIDPANDEELEGFLGQWGFPFSPYRCSDWLGQLTHDEPLFRDEKLHEACESSLYLSKHCFNLMPPLYSESGTPFESVLSHFEAVQTIRLLQLCVSCLRKVASGEARMMDESGCPTYESLFIGVFTAASCNPNRIDGPWVPDAGLGSFGLLTSAIANQVVEACQSPEPWRLCVQCGTPFKLRQSPRAKRPQKDSVICCQKCNNNRQSDKHRARKRAAL